MKRKVRRAAVFALFAAVAGAQTTASSNQFVWVSDIHFNPVANPRLADMLVKAPVSDWTGILNTNPGRRSRFGEDTNWPLLSNAFAEIRKIAPQARFTVVTGDLFVHDLRDKFNAAATAHDDAAFADFARKTFAFVAIQLEALAPGQPVLFTLGNNDVDTCDYDLQPGGPFLRNTDEAVRGMLGRLADDESTRGWEAMGTYNVRHPALRRARIISLSSTYFSQKYQAYCGSQPSVDPAENQLTWLSRQLASAKSNGDKVWLIFHIAPGIDGYATARPKNHGPGNPVVPMWKPMYTEQFEKLLNEYRDIVSVSLAGHEHVDDFRLINHSLVLLAPAISPLVGQSPAFRTVTYNNKSELTDATTYYLSNLEGLDQATDPEWKLEYSFAQQRGMKRLNFKNFNTLFHRLETDPSTQSKWMSRYGVSHPAGHSITPATFPWLVCAAGNTGKLPYDACVNRMLSAHPDAK